LHKNFITAGKQKKNLFRKNCKITGQVTKYNPQIMGKNWIQYSGWLRVPGGFDLHNYYGSKRYCRFYNNI